MVTRYYRFKTKRGEGIIGTKYKSKRKPKFRGGSIEPVSKKTAQRMLRKSSARLKKAKPKTTTTGKTGARYTKLYPMRKK